MLLSVWQMWKMLTTQPGNEDACKQITQDMTMIMIRLLAQTTLRNILGTKNLHEILSDRESISCSMQVWRSQAKRKLTVQGVPEKRGI